MSMDEMKQKIGAVNSLLSNSATSAEGQAILAAAAVLAGKPIAELNAAYKDASTASAEVQAILAAGAVFSGKPIAAVNDIYDQLSFSGTYKARAILAGTIAISGQSTMSVNWAYNRANGGAEGKAILAGASTFSGKDIGDVNDYYYLTDGPSEKALVAAAAVLTGKRITGNVLAEDSLSAAYSVYLRTVAGSEHGRAIAASAAILSNRPVDDVNSVYTLCDGMAAGRTAQAKATVTAAAVLSGKTLSKGAQFLAIVGA